MSFEKGVAVGILAAIIVFIGVICVHYVSYKAGYERACKDFYNGSLRMELVHGQWRWIDAK